MYNPAVGTLTLGSRAGIARPSPTLAITAQAQAMIASGIDVISFAAGEPDFNTPEPICDAAIEAIREGFTKYTPTPGMMSLRELVAERVSTKLAASYSPNQIVVSCGAKHSLFNALWVLLDPGDEVIVFSPYWATYADQIRLCGATPVPVKTDAGNGFMPTAAQVKEQITPRTKAILLNSPCNPTGAVFPRSLLKELAVIALQHDLWVVSDEIYEALSYDEPHVSIASLGSDIRERSVIVSGVSKSYSMTGWRVGYMAAPAAIAKAVACFQDQVTSNPSSISQKAAYAALQMSEESVSAMRASFKKRRDLAAGELAKLPGINFEMPRGAFYLFFSVELFLRGSISDDSALAEFLLNEAHVALVPGSVFDAPGFLRLSYTASNENIVRGIGRMAQALARI